MICIIVGTNRPKSRSKILANIAAQKFKKAGQKVEILDLAELDYSQLTGNLYGTALESLPEALQSMIKKVNECDGLYIVCPEYNGSMPGALKYFIDFWDYPKSFEFRPVAFLGLGFRFAGLRPVEHLQQVFGYRNAFVYPERIFVPNITDKLDGKKFTDKTIDALWSLQIERYCLYIKALREAGLVN